MPHVKMIVLAAAILASFGILPASSYAQSVTLCSMHRDNLSEKDGSGYYWDLLRDVFASQGMQLNIKSAPFKRCLHELERKKVDGAVAVFKTSKRSKIFTYPKIRLHYSSYGLAYLEQSAPLLEQERVQLVGKNRGYDFSMWLPENYEIFEINEIPQALRMLEAGRLNFLADDIQDILYAMRHTGKNPNDFIFKVMFTNDLYLPFTKDHRGRMLAKIFEQGLKTTYENGKLEMLLTKYDVVNSILSDFE